MLRTHRFSVLLTLYFFGSLILFLWGVQQMPVTDPVESLYALTAKEMVLSGDWISPQVFGSFWYDSFPPPGGILRRALRLLHGMVRPPHPE